jgi:LAS superfamily LD-carboxypeptidase LdcB
VRALALVLVVAIIAVTVLVLVLADRRRKVRRGQLHDLSHELSAAQQALTQIAKEVHTQLTAGYPDLPVIQGHLDAYNDRINNRKARPLT